MYKRIKYMCVCVCVCVLCMCDIYTQGKVEGISSVLNHAQ